MTSIASLRFLVVDDHAFQRGMLVRMLRRLGAGEITEAEDGATALAHCNDVRPDIIICDLDMPGMDGMAFIRHLGESGINTSMILSSALDRSLVASVGTMTRAYGIHLLGILDKPALPEQLALLIELYRGQPEPHAGKALPAFPIDTLLEAIAAGQFVPYFQPKVSLADGRVIGAEALARWHHPELGVISPYSFIETLEGAGRIDELSWFMISASAHCCREWQREGNETKVSVNVSLSSLNKSNFADRITETVLGAGLDPHQMILEITESTAMTHVAQALENLARLRIKGFGLSIDDYGTGYSSMQQLTRISFTELKIDQSFVSGAFDHEACRVVLETSLDTARKLHLATVAEGIETKEDWRIMNQLGCDMAQGFYIAKPMPDPEFRSWMGSWHPPKSDPDRADLSDLNIL